MERAWAVHVESEFCLYCVLSSLALDSGSCGHQLPRPVLVGLRCPVHFYLNFYLLPVLCMTDSALLKHVPDLGTCSAQQKQTNK